jgi:Tol biopolymer transport system component
MNEFLLVHKSQRTFWKSIRFTQNFLMYFVVVLIALVGCGERTSGPKIWYVWRNVSSAEIRVLDPISNQQRVIVRSERGEDILGADLSPDGQYIAYGINASKGGTSIWLVDARGSSPKQITQGAESVWSSWLDRNSLIVSSGDWIPGPTLPPLDFYIYDISMRRIMPVVVSGSQRDLFRCAMNKFSDHPERVALSDNSRPALGHLELKDGTIKIVTDSTIDLSEFPELIDADCLSWTPDGKRIVLQGTTVLLKREDLFLASNQGRAVVRLTDFGKDFEQATFSTYAISPDGQWVVAIASLNPRPVFGFPYAATLVLVKTDTKKVTFMGLPDILGPDRLVWSPDSRYVAITAPKVFDRMSDNQIYVIDIEKKEIRQLANDSGQKEVFDWR